MFRHSNKALAWFAAVILFLVAVLAQLAVASDHADPMWLAEDEQEANITGLFFFPDGDRMVVIFNVRRALTGPPPYNLEPFEYNVHMDTHSKVSFDNAEDVARYGGTVETPENIAADVTLKFLLNNDTTVKEQSFKGLLSTDNIKVFTGVRDDPFIFTKFFGFNVISMVVSIPGSAFPPAVKTWVLWGTTNRVSNGKQIDHVGRSNRTQLGRFEILNTVPPNQHVAVITKAAEGRKKVQDFLADAAPPLANLNQLSGFLIRHYDVKPDVMIYTSARPPGFPNGRRLTDDVALLTCAQGDCPLQENAFIDHTRNNAHIWPRAVVNDKPFLSEFPYLAEPWPFSAQMPGARGPYVYRYVTNPIVQILVGIGVVALIAALIAWRWRRRRVA
jgi:hypothetical protein